MTDLTAGILALNEALQRSPLSVKVNATRDAEFERAKKALPLTDAMIESYRSAAPLAFEIPWAVERLRLFSPKDLTSSQVGYRWVGDVNGVPDDEWNMEWIVIGDCSADPVIANTSKPQTPVLMAMHGAGRWEPVLVATSLAEYLFVLANWIETLTGFGGRIRNDDGEIRVDLLHSLRARLSGRIPETCIENLFSFTDI